MKRRSKLIFSLISLCFSIAVLCFGVYSALSVSYSISGSVSYEINDVFVSVTRKVYRALSETPVQSSHSGNVTELKTAQTIDTSKYDDIGADDSFSTYDNGNVTSSGQDYTYPEDGDESKNIDLTYGSPTGNETQGYAFYIVIDIHNLGSEIINAQITAPTSLENTILRDSGNVEITANDTERIVLGLALDDVTTGITSANFTYTITISRGELPEAEPITDMVFSVDEATKTATLTSYTGTGGNVVIPETIGYDTTSSMTLTFETMEDMMSNNMNMIYFYQDLNITLPNQEAQLIENPMLWLYANMETIQAAPEDYFPMTIQTVESYTIDQEDYTLYATLGQSAPMMITIMPIQMIIEGLGNSVDVQYGTEEQSFTFNMDNYNAAVNEGDDSATSTAIDDFMSKMESDPESLLPVTYTNLEYGFAVKGKEYSVTSIGDSAFYNCSALTSIDIPSSVTSIGNYAFDDCDKLGNITVDPSNANYCNDEYGVLFNKDKTELIQYPVGNTRTQYTIPSSVTSIGSYAFRDCSNLTSIDIPSSVTSIGERTFDSCSALETVTFGDNSQLESIGTYTFTNCSKLTSIEIPSSVTSIGERTFNSCSALETVTFGANSQLESIGSSAFSSTPWLTNLQNTSYGIATASDGQTRFA